MRVSYKIFSWVGVGNSNPTGGLGFFYHYLCIAITFFMNNCFTLKMQMQ